MRAILGIAVLLAMGSTAWATSVSHGPDGNRSEMNGPPVYPSDDEAFTGTVVSVAKDSVNVSNSPMQVKPGLTSITVDGKAASLQQLKAGERVAVVYALDKHGHRVAHSLAVHTHAAPTPSP